MRTTFTRKKKEKIEWGRVGQVERGKISIQGVYERKQERRKREKTARTESEKCVGLSAWAGTSQETPKGIHHQRQIILQ